MTQTDYLTDLRAHYSAVRARLNGAGIKTPPPAPSPPPVVEVKKVEEKKEVWVDPMPGVCAPVDLKLAILQILKRHNMTWSQSIANKRTLPYLRVRGEIYIMLRERGWSYPKIGKFCGGRDHTTVLHSIGRYMNHYCDVVRDEPDLFNLGEDNEEGNGVCASDGEATEGDSEYGWQGLPGFGPHVLEPREGR